MKEFLEILAVARRIRAAGQPFAVATIVKIGGSTYRRPGARMLVDGDGQTWGTISGGCLEGEVAQQALAVLEQGRPLLLPFELGEDDLVLGFGTGCDGVVHVLIEPVPAGRQDSALDLFDRCIEARHRGVMATVIEATGDLNENIGQHLLVDEAGELAGTLVGSLVGSSLEHAVHDAARRLLDAEKTREQPSLWHTQMVEQSTGSAEILLEVVRPPVRLLVFGEGHDVRAMVSLAKPMGWQVVVVGRKPADILAERFPEADDHLFMMHPEEISKLIEPDALSAALVMNHTYLRDRELMAALLDSSIPYIGMLGPKERTARMIEELRHSDAAPTEAQLARVFGPVGLDIGTETPEEIALAAAAEIQAVLSNRMGGNLRERSEPIHAARTEMQHVG